MTSPGGPSIKEIYQRRRTLCLESAAERLNKLIEEYLEGVPRIDRVSCRAKTLESFLKKASKVLDDGSEKYPDPIADIQDQLAARVIVYYVCDIEVVQEKIEQYFGSIESKRVAVDSPNEFGYEGQHYILFTPSDIFPDNVSEDDRPTVFELQIKTLFQHAWSEAEHDLGYKCKEPLTFDQKRLLACTAAQAWGADRIFGELVAARV
jgi:putative GTP pyrophosphokinase